MRKIVVMLLALALMVLSASLASAQDANEWSQYQKDRANTGFMNVTVPNEGKVSSQTSAIEARDGSEPVVAGNRAYVYTGVDDAYGSIVCLDLTTGEKVWETEVGPPTFWSWSSPAVSGGVVYIGSGKKVHALNALHGSEIWTKDLTEIKANAIVCNSSPTIDGDYLFIGDYNNGCYYCLDTTKNGAPVWTFDLDANSMAASTPAVEGGRVFVGQSAAYLFPPNGKVWCVDRNSGKPVPSWGTNGYFKTVDTLDVTGSISVYDDCIYFTDFTFGAADTPNSHLYCLDREIGSESWRTDVFPSSGTPAVGDDMVVTAGNQWGATSTNWTTAFTAKPGAGGSARELWRKKDIGGYVMSASIVDGKVLVGNYDANTFTNSGIYCLDAASGDTVWSSTQAGSVPVPTRYGVLSIGDGKLITFGSDLMAAAGGEFYFAEGCTLPGYQEWICLQNANDYQINANIQYMLADGTTRDQPVALPAQSRTTVDVNLFLGPGCEASAHVTGNGPFVAERAMYADTGGVSGGEQVMGVSEPGKSFLFAEGTTRSGYQTWLALQNPGDQEADAIVTYYYTGRAPMAENITIPATSRKTIDVNLNAGAGQDVSIAVTANRDIVAERVMYFKDPNPILGESPDGVHNSTGTDRAGTTWYFAEGTTRNNFREWLCLMNPGGEDATANIRYLTFDRGVINKSKNVPANSRITVSVNDDVAAETDLSMQVDSDRPLVAERPMYFQYQPVGLPGAFWDGGHNTMGTQYAAYDWCFAEGTTRPGFQTYLCISNPHFQDVEVTVKYITNQDWTNETKTEKVTVAGNSRHTIRVNEVVGQGKDVSFEVTSGVPIVVERPMYFSAGGYVGGGASLGFTEMP